MGLNVDQELFGVFAFYSAILIVKMMSMAFLTARCAGDEEGEKDGDEDAEGGEEDGHEDNSQDNDRCVPGRDSALAAPFPRKMQQLLAMYFNSIKCVLILNFMKCVLLQFSISNLMK